MKLITLFIILTYVLFAKEDLDLLYEKALDYEKKEDYKNAMQIYKQIAEISTTTKSRQQTAKKIEKDSKSNYKKTEKTITQMLNSSFNIYPYEENYFLPFSYVTNEIKTRENAEAKFQLSIKKPIISDVFNLDETIYFGYTQTSWWQIYANSAPFRETNYKPEIFMTIPYNKDIPSNLKAIKIGLIHESNGQGSSDSRSWNRIYAQTFFQFSNLFFNPRVWYRIPESEREDDNPDIEDFLGYGDLNLVFPYKSHNFKLTLRNNLKLDDDNKGYGELTWSFPFFDSKNSFGYFQLSNGYGDSLIDYDRNINRFSFGISLSR